ncbi:hypothetical protein MKI84_05485 [Ancylobacter sp. A5.8]|uniref:hypothetical protein n=1 Tax=Ancylobacter gelatini TaxID=2919920 RepID=UPI001F4E358F|nr:hypothetical protein [Ancylobacter gelatini]MCJ8142361.1 hypothetical protein [Ancylobacter gelatini]
MLHELRRCASPLSARPFSAALALLLIAGGSAAADCTCRAGGRDYQLGERVCLSAPSGPLIAVCAMSQNVSSWVFANEPCSVSRRPAPQRLAAGALRPH